MIRNRKSRANALGLRAWIAGILGSHSHLERLPYKQIQARLGGRVPIASIKRHVSWLRAEYSRDRLRDFTRAVARARTAPPD